VKRVTFAGVALVMLTGVVWWALDDAEPDAEPATRVVSLVSPQSPPQLDAARASPQPLPVAVPTEQLAARALSSAQSTVQTQQSLLEDNQYALFVQSFTEAQRAVVTREAFDACRVRVKQVPVRPDWEMAESSVVDGHAVRSVSMFGKSLTSFRETEDGRWLADSVWCLPVGLP
jgi:hypothetical protein